MALVFNPNGPLGAGYYATDGNDFESSGVNSATIFALAGNDGIYGGNGNDSIVSGAGNDILDGGSGADWMEGSLGDDIYYVDTAGDVVLETPTLSGTAIFAGYDTIYTTVSFNLTGNYGVEVLDAGRASQGVNLTGNDLTKFIRGGASDDVLTGWRLNYDNTTTFDGRGGDDTMIGGLGNDNYYVDSAGDVILDPGAPDFIPDGGLDTVFASVSYTLGAGQKLERLYADAGNTGLALTGNEIANTIRGKGGDDTLAGGGGMDVLIGGAGADCFVLQPLSADRDRINDFVGEVDRLLVFVSVFGELDGPGLAFADRFLVNDDGRSRNGGTADTRFVYNEVTGGLYFDADGTGAQRGVLIANLNGAPMVEASDFLIL